MCYLIDMKNTNNNGTETMQEMNLGWLKVNDAELLAKLETIRAEYVATIARLNKETAEAMTAHLEGQRVTMRDNRNAKRVHVLKGAVEIVGSSIRVEATNGTRAMICLEA